MRQPKNSHGFKTVSMFLYLCGGAGGLFDKGRQILSANETPTERRDLNFDGSTNKNVALLFLEILFTGRLMETLFFKER